MGEGEKQRKREKKKQKRKELRVKLEKKKQYKFNVQFGWSLTEKGSKLEQIQSQRIELTRSKLRGLN